MLLMGYRSAIKIAKTICIVSYPTPAFIHDLLSVDGCVKANHSVTVSLRPWLPKAAIRGVVATVWRDRRIEPGEGVQVLYHWTINSYKDYACVTDA